MVGMDMGNNIYSNFYNSVLLLDFLYLNLFSKNKFFFIMKLNLQNELKVKTHRHIDVLI